MSSKNNRKIKSALFIAMGFFLLVTTSCRKDKKPLLPPEISTVTDIDGNTYKTVKIDNQWWMVENLRVKRYRDSSLIQETKADAGWTTDTTGSYCAYYNEEANSKKY